MHACIGGGYSHLVGIKSNSSLFPSFKQIASLCSCSSSLTKPKVDRVSMDDTSASLRVLPLQSDSDTMTS